MTSELRHPHMHFPYARNTSNHFLPENMAYAVYITGRVSTGEQNLSRILTDMIDSTSTEFSIELLGPEAPEVLDGEGPEVQHIVPGEGISLLQQHHFGPQESQLDGCT